MMSDSTPSTFSGVAGTACDPKKHSRRPYSGLVPMSPYTTPSAVIVSGSRGRGPPCAGELAWSAVELALSEDAADDWDNKPSKCRMGLLTGSRVGVLLAIEHYPGTEGRSKGLEKQHL